MCTNFRGFNFSGDACPRKLVPNENFCVYGMLFEVYWSWWPNYILFHVLLLATVSPVVNHGCFPSRPYHSMTELGGSNSFLAQDVARARKWQLLRFDNCWLRTLPPHDVGCEERRLVARMAREREMRREVNSWDSRIFRESWNRCTAIATRCWNCCWIVWLALCPHTWLMSDTWQWAGMSVASRSHAY